MVLDTKFECPSSLDAIVVGHGSGSDRNMRPEPGSITEATVAFQSTTTSGYSMYSWFMRICNWNSTLATTDSFTEEKTRTHIENQLLCQTHMNKHMNPKDDLIHHLTGNS